ncbi:MAG: phosphoribosyltransferase family protein [Chitinophagales bacterium]|nr:phosphoribosyltransferase family protein [Chitinophagales bacterium]MDW8428159.1 phosphoribosyltransferase family protein [Chitinophagales bacterium]
MSTTVIQRSLVLNSSDIARRIQRIAFEIMEQNYEETDLILAGIRQKGFVLAQRLEKHIMATGRFNIVLTDIQLQKRKPTQSEILMGIDPSFVNNKVIIVCDDVANTGQTLLYAMKPFLDFAPKKIQVAVLIDRRHKQFPVSADFVGLSLATTMHQHITVEIGSGIEEAVYLS